MDELPINVYQVKQIRELERLALEEGFSEIQLMENAGKSAFKSLCDYFPTAQNITVLCGKGNNGGDGFVLARLAHQAGMNVLVYYLGNIDEFPNAAAEAFNHCQQSGVTLIPYSNEIFLDDTDVIVDALLGIGIKNEVRDEIKNIIQVINESSCEVFSLDVPSGLHADTGAILGAAVYATVTITFIALKQGLLTADGLMCCGELICDDLQLPNAIFDRVDISAYRLDWLECQHWFMPRVRNVHKGNFGHVLVIGGDYGMAGAVRMAGEAALRVGAGLVTIATRQQHVAAIVANRPELMCYGINDAADLSPLLEQATVIIVGPGLGFSDWSKQLFELVLTTKLPMIIDASALHLLAEKPYKYDCWILTPHPGEAAKLLNKKSKDIQHDRFSAAQELQQHYGGIIILKGAGTLIQAENVIPSICIAGNPGMASAGMGDVLSGILGGLIAQHYDIAIAAELAVCLHATAGDVAAQNGERGLLASDLIFELRRLVNG